MPLTKRINVHRLPTYNGSDQMWGIPGRLLTNSQNSSVAGDEYVMLNVSTPITITAAMFEIASAPGADRTAHIGFFAHDPATGKPGTLLADFGEVSIAAAFTGQKISTGTLALGPGVYWGCLRYSSGGAPTTYRVTVAHAGSTPAELDYYGSNSLPLASTPASLTAGGDRRTYILFRWT